MDLQEETERAVQAKADPILEAAAKTKLRTVAIQSSLNPRPGSQFDEPDWSRSRSPPKMPRKPKGACNLSQTKQHESKRALNSRSRILRNTEGDDVFHRLSRPKLGLPRASVPDQNGNGSPPFVGRTVPNEFTLSGTSNPAQFHGTRSSDATMSSRRAALVDIKNYDPTVRTVPQPFKLQSVQRHELACARRLLALACEEKELEQRRRYRAIPLRQELLQGPTFVPLLAPPEASITTPIESYCKNSDVRELERAQFDSKTKQRLEHEAELAAQALADKEGEEDSRRRADWLANAFRARKIPPSHYDMEQLPTLALPFPPTHPRTPTVMRRRRVRTSQSGQVMPSRIADYSDECEPELSCVTEESR